MKRCINHLESPQTKQRSVISKKEPFRVNEKKEHAF